NGWLIGQFNGTTTQFYLNDELGSVLATFSDIAGSATVLANQAYGPYGNKLYSAGSMGTSKGYTGQRGDPTGLDYYNARYYDPVVGLFVSADIKQGNAQGMDPFASVGGNPETMNDPTGLDASSSSSLSVQQVMQGLSGVAGLAGNLLWEAIDLVFNFSGMVKDIQVLADSKATWLAKLGAGADLGFTVFTDINMLDGEGEAARAAEVGAQIAEKGVVDA